MAELSSEDLAAANADLSRLTESERRIVSLVSAGRTNAEVAKRLVLSTTAVEWSVAKICCKLHVRSRTELTTKLRAARRRHRLSQGKTKGAQ